MTLVEALAVQQHAERDEDWSLTNAALVREADRIVTEAARAAKL
jgi:hypothetical protein